MFMLVEVPEPVWKTSMGNSWSHWPAATSSAGLVDGGGHLLVDRLEASVLQRGRPLDGGQRRDQRPLDGGARDREVLDGPLRLGLPFGRLGNPNLAHGVVLDAVLDLVSLMWGRYSTDGGPS